MVLAVEDSDHTHAQDLAHPHGEGMDLLVGIATDVTPPISIPALLIVVEALVTMVWGAEGLRVIRTALRAQDHLSFVEEIEGCLDGVLQATSAAAREDLVTAKNLTVPILAHARVHDLGHIHDHTRIPVVAVGAEAAAGAGAEVAPAPALAQKASAVEAVAEVPVAHAGAGPSAVVVVAETVIFNKSTVMLSPPILVFWPMCCKYIVAWASIYQSLITESSSARNGL